MLRSTVALLGSLTLAAFVACEDKKPDIAPVPVATIPTPAASVSAAAVASVAPSASAVPNAVPSGVATAVPSAIPSAAILKALAAVDPSDKSAGNTLSKAATSASSAPSAGPSCGDKPLPPCPLYAWMKANTSPAMASQDFAALATALDKIVTLAPPGYGNWASISRDGAKAARDSKLDGVKGACRGCHDQYKSRYKKEMRDRKI